MNRNLIMLNLFFRRDGERKANYLKKHKVFHKQGENCYYQPFKIPSEPFLVALHNNVKIAANVTFVTHDIVGSVFNNIPDLKSKGEYGFYMGTIEIFDNVFIGANSTIMYNVKIGANSIIAAGSVVTKDVSQNTIVGGNPAKVIGYVDKLAEKRREVSKSMPLNLDPIEKINNYFWKE